MNLKTVLALLAIACSCAISSSWRRLSADDELAPGVATALHDAKHLAQRGEHDDAIRSLSDAITMHPTSGDLFWMRGVLHQRSEHHQNAINDFTKATELECRRPALAYAGRAACRLRLGDCLGAIEDLNAAITEKPDLPHAYLLRATIHQRNGNFERAIKDFDNAIRFEPSPEAFAFLGRAICHLRVKNFPAACSDATSAARIDPSNPRAFYVRALAHGGRGDDEAAEADYATVVATHSAKAELPSDLIGTWRYQSHKSTANPPPPTETWLTALEVTKEFLVYPHPSGVRHKIEYELIEGGGGWIIDMYPQYGPDKGRIFPSRVSLVDDELRIMMPLDSRASRRRPKILQADGNPEWVVFVFQRDVSDR